MRASSEEVATIQARGTNATPAIASAATSIRADTLTRPPHRPAPATRSRPSWTTPSAPVDGATPLPNRAPRSAMLLISAHRVPRTGPREYTAGRQARDADGPARAGAWAGRSVGGPGDS